MERFLDTKILIFIINILSYYIFLYFAPVIFLKLIAH